MSAPIRIANASGFYGDRLEAAREMVEGGPIDVLTGDWLAELTMFILARQRLRDPTAGFARTFLAQLEMVLGTCLDRGIRIVSNAGGLAPARLAEQATALAERLGLAPRIAWVDGDDLLERIAELRAHGHTFPNLETGTPLNERTVLTANAYLGGWGITEALEHGADVVITGRVTDASLVVGPAAWHHGWRRDHWDALAGAVVAGHILECGTQATGGNYAFFEEVPGLWHLGYPIAEVAEDGSSVITKHPAHGGLVSPDTVTAQLLYEIAEPGYLNPDVTAHFDSIRLEQLGPDRVRVSGVRGSPPPPTTKVTMTLSDGWRTTVTLYATGLDIDAKFAAFQDALWRRVDRRRLRSVHSSVSRTDRADPATNEQATAALRITVVADDPNAVGRAFTARVTELALASYPGLWGEGLTGAADPVGVLWPSTIPNELVLSRVHIATQIIEVPATAGAERLARPHAGSARSHSGDPREPVILLELGRLVGARSGDKGGTANLGVWARRDDVYAWLRDFLDEERLAELLPETACFPIARYELENLRALNFVIPGLLGEGVASSIRRDPQAKSLGEWLRARVVHVPVRLVE